MVLLNVLVQCDDGVHFLKPLISLLFGVAVWYTLKTGVAVHTIETVNQRGCKRLLRGHCGDELVPAASHGIAKRKLSALREYIYTWPIPFKVL